MVALGPWPVQVVLLVGGRGTRLRPLTDDVPKCLAPVEGSPFLELLLRRLRGEGVERVVLCTGYRGDMVERVIGDGTRLGLAVSYSREERPLGTIGAVRAAAAHVDDAFVLMYGDAFPRAAVRAVTEAAGRRREPAAMTVIEAARAGIRGNVEIEDGRVTRYDKAADPPPAWLDYGILVLEKQVVVESAARDEAGLYPALAGRGQLAALPVDQPVWEIGDHDSYAAFCRAVAAGEAGA